MHKKINNKNMGFSHYFLKCLSLFDVYSTPFKIQFLYRTSFQTNFGGLVSLILYIILAACFIFLYILLHKKEEQRINSFDLRYNIPAQFELNIHREQMEYSKKGSYSAFFFPACYVVQNGKALTLEEVESNFNLAFVYKKRGKDRATINLTIKNCEEVFPNISNIFKNNKLQKSFCLDVNETYQIQGESLTRNEINFNYLSINLQKKNESSEASTDNLQFFLLYSDYSINNKLHDQSPLVPSMKQLPIDILPGFEISYDVYLSLDEFQSQDNLYAHWAERYIQRIARVNRLSKRVMPFKDEDGERNYISIVMRSDWYYIRYIRNYKTFFEFIYQIGGLWKVLVFIGGLLVVGINQSLMNVSISNQFFNVINPVNEKNVLLPYGDYIKEEDNNRKTPPIFLSLNPILKQISFEYYRFERNRGMDFSIKEALSKLFCCCCKIKIIEQKDQIFNESGKEIEKVLDTTSVTRFAQEANQINELLLKKVKVMLNYMCRKNLNYDTLYQIKQSLIQHKILNSATPIALTYYKQEYFIKGFITIKNQGDLTKEDLLLIREMHLNETLVRKFFLMYDDRLDFIYPPKKTRRPKERKTNGNESLIGTTDSG